jgi:hypothetical protein
MKEVIYAAKLSSYFIVCWENVEYGCQSLFLLWTPCLSTVCLLCITLRQENKFTNYEIQNMLFFSVNDNLKMLGGHNFFLWNESVIYHTAGLFSYEIHV